MCVMDLRSCICLEASYRNSESNCLKQRGGHRFIDISHKEKCRENWVSESHRCEGAKARSEPELVTGLQGVLSSPFPASSSLWAPRRLQHLSLWGGQAGLGWRWWGVGRGRVGLVAWPPSCKSGSEQGHDGGSEGEAAFTEVWGGSRDIVLKGSPVQNTE